MQTVLLDMGNREFGLAIVFVLAVVIMVGALVAWIVDSMTNNRGENLNVINLLDRCVSIIRQAVSSRPGRTPQATAAEQQALDIASARAVQEIHDLAGAQPAAGPVAQPAVVVPGPPGTHRVIIDINVNAPGANINPHP